MKRDLNRQQSLVKLLYKKIQNKIWLNYLQQVFAVQVPLLDPIVAGAAKEHVALDHQRLNAVVVRRLEVVGGSHASQGALADIKKLMKTKKVRCEVETSQSVLLLSGGSAAAHLDVMVFGAGDHQVLVVSRLIHSQTHDWTQVANELPGGGKP